MDAALRVVTGWFWQSLNWVDMLVLLVAIGGAVAGFLSGFIWQVLRIGALLVALAVAAHYHGPLAEGLAEEIPWQARLIICYMALVGGVLLLSSLALHVVRRPINALKPRAFDRLFGGVFGAAKGLLICGIVSLIVLNYTPEGTALRELVRASTLAGYCAREASLIPQLVPAVGEANQQGSHAGQ